MPLLNRKKSFPPKKLRYDIQALRAFAVVAVVLYHLWPDRLVGGFTGVDIFFVLSGYLMTLSIMRKLAPLAEENDITPRSVGRLLFDFYARRIKRLVPAALAALTGVLILITISGNLNVIITNTKNIFSAATFWQNWMLAYDSVNYLQQDNMVVATQHFWSLSVEEQFYLVWPLILVASTLVMSSVVIYHKQRKISGVILPIILLALLSLAYGVWLTNSDQTIAYYSTPARIWELMIGGIIAFLPAIKNYDLKLLLPYAGLAINFYSLFFVGTEGFPGWWALLPTIGTAMIILGGVDKPESRLSFEKMFRWRPIQWIGDISYSIYLWHFPLIVLLPVILHYNINGEHAKLFKLGIIVTTLLIAHLSYVYVEQTSQKLKLKNRTVYALFLVLTALIVGSSYVLQQQAETKVSDNLKQIHTEATDKNNGCFGAKERLNNNCNKPDLDMKFTPSRKLDNFENIIQNDFRPCDGAFRQDSETQNSFCTIGDKSSEKSIVLFGDSHAQQYINAFNDIGQKQNVKIYLLDSRDCVGEDFMIKKKGCRDRYQSFKDSDIFEKSSFIVISFLFRDYDFVKENIQFIENLTDTKYVVMQDTRYVSIEEQYTCYTLGQNCVLPKSQSETKADRILMQLIANNILKKNQVIRTEDFFCDSSKCSLIAGSAPIYFDSTDSTKNSHITASYSLSLSLLIESRLQSLDMLPISSTVSQ